MKSLIRTVLGPLGSERVKRAVAVARKPNRVGLFGSYTVSSGWCLRRFGLDGYEVFFGYYDKRQLSLDGRRLLACAVPSRVAKMSEPNAAMRVGWFDLADGAFQDIGSTRAYNWQQGCMLRWMPGSDDTLVTFNAWRDDRLVSVVIDTETGQETLERPYAFYDIAPSGELFATCSFSRLHQLRVGYGYWQVVNQNKESASGRPDDVLITIIDATSSQPIRTIAIREIELTLGEEIPASDAYVNHLSFSPDSSKLLFMIFWRNEGITRMATLFYDRAGNNLALVTSKYLSHFCWKSNEALVAWGGDDSGKRGYFEYSLYDLRQTEYWLDPQISDGHCSIRADGVMLTDTYPDAQGLQSLLLREPDGRVIPIAKLHSPVSYSFDRRCDLHPRFNGDGDCISFDSACGGRRATYLISRR